MASVPQCYISPWFPWRLNILISTGARPWASFYPVNILPLGLPPISYLPTTYRRWLRRSRPVPNNSSSPRYRRPSLDSPATWSPNPCRHSPHLLQRLVALRSSTGPHPRQCLPRAQTYVYIAVARGSITGIGELCTADFPDDVFYDAGVLKRVCGDLAGAEQRREHG